MEIQLQDLLESIQKEGIEVAEQKASEIISNAQQDADRIMQKAKSDAENIVAKAQEEAETFKQSASSAIEQRARDILISIQQSLQKSFDTIIQTTIAESFSISDFSDCLIEVLRSTQKIGVLELAPNVSEKTIANLKAKLAKEIKTGLKIQIGKEADGGFVLKEEDGKSYYDFSNASIAELLKKSLNKHISELIVVK